MILAGKEGLSQDCGPYCFEKLFVVLDSILERVSAPGCFMNFTA